MPELFDDEGWERMFMSCFLLRAYEKQYFQVKHFQAT